MQTQIMTIDHILEKGSGRVNEDSLLIGENLFGVFDGATSLNGTGNLPEGETGGQMAATIARDVFARNGYPLDALGSHANHAILDRMKTLRVNHASPLHCWSTSAAVARLKKDRLKKDRLEWFRTGDAQILLICHDGSHRVLARQPDHDYETLTLLKGLSDKSPHNPVLKRQLVKVRAGMNRRYGVLNGDSRAKDFMQSGTVSLDGVAQVLLFTDGLSIPQDTPEMEKDFTQLVTAYLRLGLDGLRKYIRGLEKSDPDRQRFPRFKCHDDVAAIALKLSARQPVTTAA